MPKSGGVLRSFEDLLRELAPQVLGVLARRYGAFAAAEDAVQEALWAAAHHWARDGVPEKPRGWLIQTASRRLIDQARSEQRISRAKQRIKSSAVPLRMPALRNCRVGCGW